MAVKIIPEYLKDHTVFRYEIRQCQGVSAECGSIDIPHDHVHRLPVLPEDFSHEVMGEAHLEDFKIPGTDNTVAFVIGSWKETGFGERVFELRGPYYKPK